MLTSRAVWREMERVEKGALFGESDGKSMLGSESFSWETGRAVQCRARAARRVRAVLRMCIVMALNYSIVPGYLALSESPFHALEKTTDSRK